MEFITGEIYHIYNRGNNKQKIFFKEANYLFFLKKVKLELMPYCEILIYCLMPNHFHLLVWVKEHDENIKKKTLNMAIAVLLRSYTRAIQGQENFTGSLFQQKTKSKQVVDTGNEAVDYTSMCAHYIHHNPIKAYLVKELKNWEFSSFPAYAGLRNDEICNKELFYSITNTDKEGFIMESERILFEKSSDEYQYGA